MFPDCHSKAKTNLQSEISPTMVVAGFATFAGGWALHRNIGMTFNLWGHSMS